MSKIDPELEAKIQKRLKWQEDLKAERQGLTTANNMREGYISALKWVLQEAQK